MEKNPNQILNCHFPGQRKWLAKKEQTSEPQHTGAPVRIIEKKILKISIRIQLSWISMPPHPYPKF